MLAPARLPWLPRLPPARVGVSVTLRQVRHENNAYLCGHCLFQLGVLGSEGLILRESVCLSRCNQPNVIAILRTFAVIAAEACSSSASLAAKASSCAGGSVNYAATSCLWKKHTFAVIAVDACSSSASLAAMISSCANLCVSPVATGQTRYQKGAPLTSVLPMLAPVLHL